MPRPITTLHDGYLRCPSKGTVGILADARRQPGIGGVAEIPEKELRVGEINHAIAVYIAPRNIAVVGKHHGRIQAIQQHIQHIKGIDLAIAVHIPQNPARSDFHSRTAMRCNHNVHLIISHPKSRVHIGDQARARNRQPINRPICFHSGRIERMGVMLPQRKVSRQSRAPRRRECWQRQRKMPGLVRGRTDEPTQVGPIKQPHLHPSRWLPRR